MSKFAEPKTGYDCPHMKNLSQIALIMQETPQTGLETIRDGRARRESGDALPINVKIESVYRSAASRQPRLSVTWYGEPSVIIGGVMLNKSAFSRSRKCGKAHEEAKTKVLVTDLKKRSHRR